MPFRSVLACPGRVPAPVVSSFLVILSVVSLLAWLGPARAASITIDNPGFEDTTGQVDFNEFTFGTPVGWTLYDPNNIVPLSGVFVGTLEPNGVDFFNTPAPEGDLVSILFASDQLGAGEYGFRQDLSAVLEAGMQYELSVAVGNIASGTATNGVFFNLDEFPGYRVDLLAGDTVIAQDLNSLSIPEGEFATSTVSYLAGAGDPLLGQTLGIRLVNLNQIPAGFDAATSPDLEVDFDDVSLNAFVISEPGGLGLMAVALLLSGVGFRWTRMAD